MTRITHTALSGVTLLAGLAMLGCTPTTTADTDPEQRPTALRTAAVSKGDDAAPHGIDSLLPPPDNTEDCCTVPGQYEECWATDAKKDRVTCKADGQCPSGQCDLKRGVCKCDSDAQCNEGICTSRGLCGPSYCNGIYSCTCTGGCVFEPAQDIIQCKSYRLHCCDGTYPIHPSLRPDGVAGIGFCSLGDECGNCVMDSECDDGVFCNGAEKCVGLECEGGAPPCKGAEACKSVCNEQEKTCLSPTGSNCDDGVFCNGADSCDGAGSCVHGGDPCAAHGFCDNLCDEHEASCARPASTSCDDGVACTAGDVCDGAGSCGGTPYSCAAAECEGASSCDGKGGCLPSYAGTPGKPCDDNVACTEHDICDGAGTCKGMDKDCTALSGPCSNGRCNPASGNCEADPFAVGTLCDDSNPCTIADKCDASHSCTGQGRSCDDGNPCTADSCAACKEGSPGCNAGGWRCVHAPLSGTTCDDGDVCTLNDTCDTGSCAPGALFDCTARDTQCQVGACKNDGTGRPVCVDMPMSSGVPCDADGNGCTVADQCNGAGVCKAGAAPNCSAWSNPNICRRGVCQSDGPTAYHCTAAIAQAGTACNDRNGCTSADTCNAGGSCVGASVVGAAANCKPNGCQTASCTSVSDTTYTCNLQTKSGCCLQNADCKLSTTCGGASAQCATARCNGSPGTCECQISTNASCTDFNQFQYPTNCYEGTCASSGTCVPRLKSSVAANDTCRGLFASGSAQPFGSFVNTDGERSIWVSGSTECATNNYRSAGADCVDSATLQPLGREGKDVVYAFTYQTPAAHQYQLYSYNIKVWSTFRANVYTTSDIDSASACPEGKSGPVGTAYGINSDRCLKSYSAAPDVSEEFCWDNGNETLGQDGCYPYLLPGDDSSRKCGGSNCSGTSGVNRCGYYWTRRFYPAGCCNYNNNTNCAGQPACTGQWNYPSDPFNCDLVNPSWTYQYVTSHVIFPDGNRNSATKTVLIFVDGDLPQPSPAAPNEGSFYISVERKRWTASPCDRRDDDARVFDVTSASGAGAVWTGSLENVVNSMHDSTYASTGSCGGYNCANTWAGSSTAHASGTPNEFWPNAEYFKVQRPSGSGSSEYCVYTDENIPSAADLVFQLWSRQSGAGICDATYSNDVAIRNTHNSNVMYRFTAAQNVLYVLNISEHKYRNRPCAPGLGDLCNYKLRVRQGACPLKYPARTFRLSDEVSPLSVSGAITAADGNHYDPGTWFATGTREDVLYEIGNSTGADATVTFRLCTTGWSGLLRLYSSSNALAKSVTANNTCTQFTETLFNGRSYYIVVDKNNATSGPFTLTMSW